MQIEYCQLGPALNLRLDNQYFSSRRRGTEGETTILRRDCCAGAGGHHSHLNCDCMEYWTCILGGGTPHSYCGLTDHDVCCFVPDNAAPVGILPTPSRGKCGRKGFDSGQEGQAEMSEWPWHVSQN